MKIMVDKDGNCSFADDLTQWALDFHDGRKFTVNCAGNGMSEVFRYRKRIKILVLSTIECIKLINKIE